MKMEKKGGIKVVLSEWYNVKYDEEGWHIDT